jgi:hypothetical protein
MKPIEEKMKRRYLKDRDKLAPVGRELYEFRPSGACLPSGGMQSAAYGLLSLKTIHRFALQELAHITMGEETKQPETCYNA